MPNNIVGSSLNNICAGDYTVNASDGNGCITSQVVTITEQPAITATVVSVNPTTCLSADASISFTLAGGTPALGFIWDNGSTIANPRNGLDDGTYTFTVTDSKGCKQIFSTTISDPVGPTVTATSNSITCFGLCNGSATLNIIGVGPFNTSWPAPVSSTNTTVSNLCVGVYVSASMFNGCRPSSAVQARPTFIWLWRARVTKAFFGPLTARELREWYGKP